MNITITMRKALPLDGEGLGRGERPAIAEAVATFTPTLPSPIMAEGWG